MRTDQPNEWVDRDEEAVEGNGSGERVAGAAEAEGREETAGGVADLRGQLEAMQDRHLRLAAEFDNYRKRTEKERVETYDRAQAQLVKQLLEPLDDLQRVAHHADTPSVESLLEGVQLVERKLLRALENAGLELLDAHGQPFDPEIHEALMAAVTEDEAEDDSVGQVFQNGYRFRGELLRPARVAVRKFEA